MKILIVSTYDCIGGAAKAAYRLHTAIASEGVSSTMLVQIKKNFCNNIIQLYSNIEAKLRFFIDNLPNRFYLKRNKVPFSNSFIPSEKLIKFINETNPDIIHLQWVNGGMFDIHDLLKIDKPIVWTFQDMWPITGGCHYDDFCEDFKHGCINCKVLNSKNCRLSKINYMKKEKIISKIDNITVVLLSEWMKKQFCKSPIFRNTNHVLLPLPIDTSLFIPSNKYECRKFFGLSNDKKLVLFGAVNSLGDKRKGFLELFEALKLIKSNSIEFIIFGNDDSKKQVNLEHKVNYIGNIDNEEVLAKLYSACDILVVPSLQETFGQVATESISCGTPVVAFDETGVADIISHKIDGYLAKFLDVKDLAEGIEWILNTENYERICKNARAKALQQFDSKVVARKYIELYQSILHR